jgi:hypothetical protein
MEISSGIEKFPHFILAYGPDGVGKTTFASEAPKSIILGPESGSRSINVHRFKNVKTWQDIIARIGWLRNEKHDFQSVGIDSLDWIEPLLWQSVCAQYKSDSIEEVLGGYGKGFTIAVNYWSQMIALLQDLRENRNMNIITIAHSQIKTMNDPLHALPYDRHMLKLNEKASAKWREAVDAVLFCNFEDTVFKVNKGDKKAKVTDGDGGARKLFSVRRAAYDAKNRLGLPASLPLSYSAFAAAAELGQPDSAEQVKADLAELYEAVKVKDADKAEKMKQAVEQAGADVGRLIKIRNHARVLAGDV